MSGWNHYLSVGADLASIVSLVVASYAAYSISKVRSQIVSRVRLPAFVDILEKHAASLAKLMGSYDERETKEHIILELTVCETNLRLVQTRADRSIRDKVFGLLWEIQKYKTAQFFGRYPAVTTREQAWKIYAELNGLIEEIKNMIAERTMGA